MRDAAEKCLQPLPDRTAVQAALLITMLGAVAVQYAVLRCDFIYYTGDVTTPCNPCSRRPYKAVILVEQFC